MSVNANKTIFFSAGIFFVVAALFLGTAFSKPAYPEKFTGRVEVTEVDVNSKVPGKIAEIKVKEGDTVSAGQVLAILENDELKAKEKQALAVVEAAYEQVHQAEEAYELAKDQSSAVIKRAQAVVDAADAQATKAQNGARDQEVRAVEAVSKKAYAGYLLADKTYQRVIRLQKEGALPLQEVDKAETALKAALEDWRAAKEQLALAKEGARIEDVNAAQAQARQAQAALSEAYAGEKQTDIRLAALQAAKAQLKQAKGGLEEVKAYLNNSTIKAPLKGTVTMISTDAGEMLSSGMPIVTISKLDETWVEVRVPETKIVDLKLGDSTLVNIAGMKKAITGEIVRISALPDFATKRATNESGEKDIVSFGVKVIITNADLLIKPGMTAEVSFK